MKACYLTTILLLLTGLFHFGDELHAAVTEVDVRSANTTGSGVSGFNNLNFIFTTTDVGASGTGTINTFLDIQASPSEQGYNSTRASGLYDEKNMKQTDDPTASGTRGLNVWEVPVGTINGDGYAEFLLDANEGGSAANQDIAIYQVQIFAATDAIATDPTLAPSTTSTTADGIPIVQFAGTQEVFRLSDGSTGYAGLVDASLGNGSGTFDLRFYWDTSILLSLDLQTYTHLIVYTYMGRLGSTDLGYDSDGGFDEWSVSLSRSTFTETVPEPGTWALLLTTACGGLFFQYRRHRKQKLATADAADC